MTFLERCAREYGDAVPLRFGPVRLVFLNHPAFVEEVLVTQQRAFVKGSMVQGLRRLLGNGLVTSDGALWLRQRRPIQPAFHRERVAGHGQHMVQSAERRLVAWADGQAREVYHEMAELTLANVARALFGADVVRESGEVTTALLALAHEQRGGPGDLQLLLPDWLPTPAIRRRRRTVRRLDAIVYRLIDRRRAGREDGEDLLTLLLQARYDDGGQMSPRQLRDEALTFFLAGHDTTAIALAWTWYLLAQHPAAEARLHAELREVLGGRSPTVADLPRLPYAGGVIAEVLRLYPPAWALARVAVHDGALLGMPIRAGTAVLFSQWVLHRDPRFFAEPERFDPERRADDRAARLPRGAYIPFGAGPRLCIGNTFALMQATLLLATIAQRFRLAPASGPGRTWCCDPSPASGWSPARADPPPRGAPSDKGVAGPVLSHPDAWPRQRARPAWWRPWRARAAARPRRAVPHCPYRLYAG